MLSFQNAGEDWAKAQLMKNVSAAKAGKNMMSRRPELTIWESMAWTMDSDNWKPKPLFCSTTVSPSVSSTSGESTSAMVGDEEACSKVFTPKAFQFQQKRTAWPCRKVVQSTHSPT